MNQEVRADDASSAPDKPKGLAAWAWKRLGEPLFVGVVVVVLVIGLPLQHIAIQQWLFGITESLHRWALIGPMHHVAATAACLAFAPLALFWRWNQRSNYGALEIVFGANVMWHLLGSQAGELTVFAGIGGSVYVIVRGVDNLRVGLAERKRDEERKKEEKRRKDEERKKSGAV